MKIGMLFIAFYSQVFLSFSLPSIGINGVDKMIETLLV